MMVSMEEAPYRMVETILVQITITTMEVDLMAMEDQAMMVSMEEVLY